MTPSIPYLWRLVGEGLALCYRAAPGYEARLTPQATLVLSGETVADLNYAVIDAGPQAAERLREIVQVIHTRRLPLIVLLTEEAANPLAPIACGLGLKEMGELPLMTYTPTEIYTTPGNYSCERVENEQALYEANTLAASAFGWPLDAVNRAWGPVILDGPGVDIFLAWQGGRAVSSVQTTRLGAMVGIWAMATAPEHQRQGAGRALLASVIAYHWERGANCFFLGASAAGQPLYERVGFRTLAKAALWVARQATEAPGHEGDAEWDKPHFC